MADDDYCTRVSTKLIGQERNTFTIQMACRLIGKNTMRFVCEGLRKFKPRFFPAAHVRRVHAVNAELAGQRIISLLLPGGIFQLRDIGELPGLDNSSNSSIYKPL